MSYNLSCFGPEFVFGEGEPYDAGSPHTNSAGKPCTLYSALTMLPAGEYYELVRACFPELPDDVHVSAEELIDRALSVDTVGSLSAPIAVWFTDDGSATVDVYGTSGDVEILIAYSVYDIQAGGVLECEDKFAGHRTGRDKITFSATRAECAEWNRRVVVSRNVLADLVGCDPNCIYGASIVATVAQ